MNKNILTPEKAERIQDEIIYSMPLENKMRLFFKVNNKVFKTAQAKVKSKYPKLGGVSFSKKLYEHIDFKREFYDNLFNRFFKKELKNILKPGQKSMGLLVL